MPQFRFFLVLQSAFAKSMADKFYPKLRDVFTSILSIAEGPHLSSTHEIPPGLFLSFTPHNTQNHNSRQPQKPPKIRLSVVNTLCLLKKRAKSVHFCAEPARFCSKMLKTSAFLLIFVLSPFRR
jgi:hypothetical protein